MLKMNYIHRDLNPENILIEYTNNNNLNFELTDFGLSTSYEFFNKNLQQCRNKKLSCT